MFKEGIYNIYISRNNDLLLLSESDRNKGFVYKNFIFFLLHPQYALTKESLLHLCKKTSINAVGIECDNGEFEINEDFFSKEQVFNQKLDYINFPNTYIYMNIFKYTKMIPAWEQLMKEKCSILASVIDKKKVNVYTLDSKAIIAFTNSDEALDYIKKENIESLKLAPMTCILGKMRRKAEVYFPSENIDFKIKKDGGY